MSLLRRFAQLIYTRELTLIYESSESIFNKQLLESIGRFEVEMRSLLGYQKLCSRMAASLRQYCDPGVSLMSFAWATQAKELKISFGFRRHFEEISMTSLDFFDFLCGFSLRKVSPSSSDNSATRFAAR